MSSVPDKSRPRKRARSLAEDLVATISQRIERGDLLPGDKLPTESAIMAEQGVSRTVVREALSRLQAAGLVETRHGVGTFVLAKPSAGKFRIDPATIVTLRDVIAILELRISLEVEAAGLAAQRRSEQQLAGIEQALRDMQGGERRGSDAVAADFRFHTLIAESTGNPYFADILSHLGISIIPRTRIDAAQFSAGGRAEYLARVNREHEDIFASIARGDSDAARAAMRMHLTNSRERLRKLHEEAEAKLG